MGFLSAVWARLHHKYPDIQTFTFIIFYLSIYSKIKILYVLTRDVVTIQGCVRSSADLRSDATLLTSFSLDLL